MGFIEFIRKNLLGLSAGWTLALKRFQVLELFIAWTMLWCRHGYLLVSVYPQMVFSRDIGVGRHDLTPQNSTLLLRVKSVVRLDLTQKSSFLDGH